MSLREGTAGLLVYFWFQKGEELLAKISVVSEAAVMLIGKNYFGRLHIRMHFDVVSICNSSSWLFNDGVDYRTIDARGIP
jgi:hypothetical protein